MRIQILGVRYYVHRVIYLWVYGYLPTQQIDHIDGNGLNNKLRNLRSVSAVENCRNMGISNANLSGVIGVHWNKKDAVWRAQIGVDNKQIHLGSFATKEAAVKARVTADLRYGFHSNHGKRPRGR